MSHRVFDASIRCQGRHYFLGRTTRGPRSRGSREPRQPLCPPASPAPSAAGLARHGKRPRSSARRIYLRRCSREPPPPPWHPANARGISPDPLILLISAPVAGYQAASSFRQPWTGCRGPHRKARERGLLQRIGWFLRGSDTWHWQDSTHVLHPAMRAFRAVFTHLGEGPELLDSVQI